MNNTPIRTELLNLLTYFQYFKDTIDQLLDEELICDITDEELYKTAWLSKCVNLQETMATFQNHFLHKREKFNLVVDRALKDLNNEVDTKIETKSVEEARLVHRENILKEFNMENTLKDLEAMKNYVSAIGNGLGTVREDLNKKFELTEHAITSHGSEIREMKNYIQQEVIPAILKQNAVLNSLVNPVITHPDYATIDEIKENYPKSPVKSEELLQAQDFADFLAEEAKEVPNKKSPKWTNYVEQVEQLMKEKNLGAHEVAELAKINFNSFRKFQKKDPKLSIPVVNKILNYFNINY